MKWDIELQEFQFTFLVEESTQTTLADLLTYKETPILVRKDVVRKKKVETFAISQASLLYFDGSYRRSHDAASCRIVVYDAQGNLVRKQGLKLNANNNSEAEYMALEGGLHICLQMGIKCLQIKGDALLLLKEELGVWKNKNPKLKNLCFKVKALLKKFEKFEAWSLQYAWSLQHIERSQNEEAHEATQGMLTCVFVVNANASLYHGTKMLSKVVDFLLTGILPEGLLSSKKYAFMRNAKKYKMLDDVLYMKGSDLILYRVPCKEEIYKILEENHEGSCGGHFAMKIMLHKILQEGYVWPSIQWDFTLFWPQSLYMRMRLFSFTWTLDSSPKRCTL
ncbi:hypothetical protein L7F22_017700 [Adiantum nelumboides]|nr:hypothetical protein [Adiantum nelumboides]